MKNHIRLISLLISFIIAVSVFGIVPVQAASVETEPSASGEVYGELVPGWTLKDVPFEPYAQKRFTITPEHNMVVGIEVKVVDFTTTFDNEINIDCRLFYNTDIRLAPFDEVVDESIMKKTEYYGLEAGETYYFSVKNNTYYIDMTADISVFESSPLVSIQPGELTTAVQGVTPYVFTPDKDMLLYFHAVGASGTFGRFSRQNSFERRQLYKVKAGQPCIFYTRTEEKVDEDFDKVYESYDFVIEELPVTEAALGKTIECEYRSPLAFENSIPDIDILWPDNTAHSAIYNLPINVISFTPEKDMLLDIDFVTEWGGAQEISLYDDDLHETAYAEYGGIQKKMIQGGKTYFLVIYGDRFVPESAAGNHYSVSFNKSDLPELSEGHNILTQKAGSDDQTYVFYIPRSADWMLSCPGAVSYQDIVLVFNSFNRGTDFALESVMKVGDGVFFVTLTANETAEDKVYDLNIFEYQYPQLEPDKATHLSLVGDGDQKTVSFTVDRPVRAAMNVNATIDNAALTVVFDKDNTKKVRETMNSGENTVNCFLEPGHIYSYTAVIRSKEYYCFAEMDITFTDRDAGADDLEFGVATGDSIEPDDGRVYRLTPSYDFFVAPKSTYEGSVYLVEPGSPRVELVSGDSSCKYLCFAGETYYIYLYNDSENDDQGMLTVWNEPIPLGDADGDGEVDLTDVTQIQYALSDLRTPGNKKALKFADVDSNGDVEIIDATYIQRWIAGIETPFL